MLYYYLFQQSNNHSSFCLVRILGAMFKPTFCMKVSMCVGEKKTSECKNLTIDHVVCDGKLLILGMYVLLCAM